MEFAHRSVLLEETIEYLNIRPDGIYVDGTLGGAGHSGEICKRLSDSGRLIGIDQDEDAIRAATKRLEPYKEKVTIIRDNYCNMKTRLEESGFRGSMESCWIWVFRPISWMIRNGGLHIGNVHHLICVWTGDRVRLQRIS